VITCVTEHHAVLDTCRRLEREGYSVIYLPVAGDGLVSLDLLAAALRETPEDVTILVSIMFANNEIGVLQPIYEIGRMCKACGALFHCDAVQALAHERVDVEEAGIDLLSISAHKMYGPKGIGALYVRRRNPRVRLDPLIDGGGHERGLRSGTLNVPGIVGLGKAAELAREERETDHARIRALRDRLLDGIQSRVGGVRIHGSMSHRLPNNLNVSIEGAPSEMMLTGMKELALSSGAACSSATAEPSHVLAALGAGVGLAQSSLRFGLHRFTTEEEVDFAVGVVARTAQRLRGLDSPPALKMK
jgi:cysteine desulfurase